MATEERPLERAFPPFDQGHRAEFTQRVQQIELPQA